MSAALLHTFETEAFNTQGAQNIAKVLLLP